MEKLKEIEDLKEAIDDLKGHLRDEYDGPIGAIGFALEENDPEQIERACNELVHRTNRVRLAAYPEELEDADRNGPRIVLVSRDGYWSAGSTFWQAVRRLPCTPDLMYVTDDPEPIIYNDGAIGIHEGKTLVRIPIGRDNEDRVLPVTFRC